MKTLTQTATFRKRKSLGTRGVELSWGSASPSPLNTAISEFKSCFSFLSVFLSIYEKLIQFCQIDELGTNYPNDMFDPHGWSEDSYYEALGKWCSCLLTTGWLKLTGVLIFAAKAQKVEMDKLEKAKKERTKVSPTTKKQNMPGSCLCTEHLSPSLCFINNNLRTNLPPSTLFASALFIIILLNCFWMFSTNFNISADRVA